MPSEKQMFCIWSPEQGRWWKPASCGYTETPRAAGKYTYDEAMSCVLASRLNKDGVPDDCLVPLELVESWLHEEAKKDGAEVRELVRKLRRSGWNTEEIKDSLAKIADEMDRQVT